jgi:hypothetical protein
MLSPAAACGRAAGPTLRYILNHELVVNTANSTSTAAEFGTASSPRLITNFQQIDDMILSSAAGWLSGLQDDPLKKAFRSHGMVLDMCSNSSPLHDVADHDSSCDNRGSLDQLEELYIRMTGIRHPAAESSPYYSVVSPAAAESCGEAAALSSQSYSSTVIRAEDTVLVAQTASALQLQLDPAESPASSPLHSNVGPPLQLVVAGDWNGNQYPVPTWIMSKS